MSGDPAQLEVAAGRDFESDQVLFVGVGRVMLAPQCICKRLALSDIRTHYVGEITKPCITKCDLLIVGSGSGESLFPLGIAKKARAVADCAIVHINSNPNSKMRNVVDFMVRILVYTKFSSRTRLTPVSP